MPEKRKALTNDSRWRENIKAGLLLERLEIHALVGTTMENSQIKAAEILLKKVLPDMMAIQVNVDGGIDINVLQVASHPPAKSRANKPASK